MNKPYYLIENMELEDQFPEEPKDVFQLYQDEEPAEVHDYCIDPPDRVTVALDKKIYGHKGDAQARAEEIFAARGLVPYKKFQTARHYCWYAAPRKR